MNDNNNFASQFIDLWQENFEKMLSTETNMSQVQQILETMKGFYAAQQSTDQPCNQSSAAANSNAHSDGDVAELVRSLSRRVAELEGRLADYERGAS